MAFTIAFVAVFWLFMPSEKQQRLDWEKKTIEQAKIDGEKRCGPGNYEIISKPILTLNMENQYFICKIELP